MNRGLYGLPRGLEGFVKSGASTKFVMTGTQGTGYVLFDQEPTWDQLGIRKDSRTYIYFPKRGRYYCEASLRFTGTGSSFIECFMRHGFFNNGSDTTIEYFAAQSIRGVGDPVGIKLAGIIETPIETPTWPGEPSFVNVLVQGSAIGTLSYASLLVELKRVP